MARDWPRLVLAAAVAFAVAEPLCVATPVAAQSAKPARKAAKKAPEAEQDKDEQGQPKKKKQDPAEAQKVIDAAQKLIEGGKAEAAASSLTTVLTAGHLPPGMMARALLYRGTANRQLQKPAQAIQDLTQALWIKGGLNDSDRAEALRQRSSAYADAGVGDAGTLAASAPSNGNRVASSDLVTTGSNTPSPSQQSGSGWNIFGGLFGGASSSQPAPSQAPPPPAPKPAASPAVSGWSGQTEVRPQAIAAAPQPVASPLPPPQASAPEGKFRVQLALLRSESEANAIASRVGGELAGVFETRRASIDQTVVGNMGTMYRVRVGPYATAQDGQAVCGRLKGTGLDCLVVSQ